MPIVSPSILSANFANLQADIEMLNESVADWMHVDVMDGVFVPNISFGFPVMKAIQPIAKKPLDVHLMIVNPEKYVERFKMAGADFLTVHYEACKDLKKVVDQIHANGMKAGVSINPETPANVLNDILPFVDLVLIMSVHPGFGGQKFIPETISKIQEVRSMIKARGLRVLIEVDGGIGLQNVEEVTAAGADAVVAGASVFTSENPKETLKKLKVTL
ncbi:MAG: ribulose-phosphate 3-epimerase [Bacteroidales bacterium]|nr:ribulose-phosphate 3-epimerase [Bacteroidales bacterium]